MPDLYLLFSHELTDQQKKEAYEELGVSKIYSLPDNLKALWSQIPPEISELASYLKPLKEWLDSQIREGDYILITKPNPDFMDHYTTLFRSYPHPGRFWGHILYGKLGFCPELPAHLCYYQAKGCRDSE